MDEIVDDLTRLARRCGRIVKAFSVEPYKSAIDGLRSASSQLEKAWCGSWIGYQSHVYTSGLTPIQPGQFFDAQGWGEHRGEWAEFSYDAIRSRMYQLSGVTDLVFERMASVATLNLESLAACRDELLPTLDALLSVEDDATVRERRDKSAKTPLGHSASDYFEAIRPKGGSFMTQDTRAIQGGLQGPPHSGVLFHFLALVSTSVQAASIQSDINYILVYIKKAMKMKGASIAKTDGPIFIGHGHSRDWKDLKDFLVEKLGLEFEEFNRIPTPGLSNKERLLEMLDRCPFAFLVMTAEDEKKDGKVQARANVIHEAGLFQGRYGFERAIVLLEHGCEEFTNMAGIGQIRFTSGKIAAESEQIRGVLERERMI